MLYRKKDMYVVNHILVHLIYWLETNMTNFLTKVL